MKKLIIINLSVVLLISCALIPVTRPKTLDQKIAVTEVAITAVINTIAENVENNVITKKQGSFALSIAYNAQTAINGAWMYYSATKNPEANTSLNIATGLLKELNKYLILKESK